MKKISIPATLLGAMFAQQAVAADAPATLTVGAMVREFLIVTDQDQSATENLNAVGMHNYVRLFAKGKAKLENGLEITTYIRFEAIGRKTEDVDEAYIDLSSAYGTLRVGEKEGWNAQFIGDPAPSAFLTPEERVVGDAFKPRNGTAYADTFSFKRYAGDPLGVQYRSPELHGFQFGLAYHPRTDLAAGPSDRNQANTNAIDASGQYVFKFDGGSVKLAGGYIHVDGKTVPGAEAGQEAWNAGVTVKVDAFTLGGAMLVSTPENGLWERDYTAGAMWTQGPWKLSADYAFLKRRPARTALLRETTGTWRGQLSYKLGPGLEAGLAGFHARQKDAAGQSWDGVGGLVGLKIDL